MSKLQLKDFIVDPCKSDKAIEFLPQKKLELQLSEIVNVLRETAQLQAETPFVTIFLFKNASISLFRSGRILVKNVEEKEAKQIVEELLEIINEKE